LLRASAPQPVPLVKYSSNSAVFKVTFVSKYLPGELRKAQEARRAAYRQLLGFAEALTLLISFSCLASPPDSPLSSCRPRLALNFIVSFWDIKNAR